MKILSLDPAIHNLAYSIVEKVKDDYKVHDFNIIDLKEKKKCLKCKKKSFYYSLENLEMIFCCKDHKDAFEKPKKIIEYNSNDACESLIKELDKIDVKDVDIVLIENQPAFKNPQAKNISIMILTYYKMKNKEVIFRSPSMKIFNHKLDCKNKYAETKKFGIKLCFKLVDNDTKNKISEFKKIDDITDSILQAISYIEGGKVPEQIKDMIVK